MVEIAPKPKTKPKKITAVLFFLSLILLLLVGGAYFGLKSIETKKQKELEEAKKQLAQKETPLKKLEDKLQRCKAKLDDLSLVLGSRLIGTEIFGFLERITHIQITWASANINAKEGEVTLTGEAETLPVLTQQLIYLKKVPEIKSFKLTNMSLGEGEKVNFGLTLKLSPSLFK